MEYLLHSVWGSAVFWFGGLWAVMLFIRKVSKDADNELKPEKREALAADLMRRTARSAGSWVPDFTFVFDNFFGEKHFRWRCIYKSALISLATFLALWLISGTFASSNITNTIVSVVAYALWLNVALDYFSLLETRILLSTRMSLALKILIDAILTLSIALVWISLLIWISGISRNWYGIGSYLGTVNLSWGLLLGNQYDPEHVSAFIRITIATSFTTSIWLWLHGLAQPMARVLRTTAYIAGWLNIEEKPLRAIGTTINIMLLLIGVTLFPVWLFLSL